MQAVEQSALPGETVLTFGIRHGAGFVTLAAADLSQRELANMFKQLDDLARKVQGNLALDLTLVKPLNCAWINGLIDYHHRCKSMGGQLVIAGLPADAADILRTTGLDRKLIISASRGDALRHFRMGEESRPGLLGWLRGRKAA
jgi:anti-anti-sigma regulatory factor